MPAVARLAKGARTPARRIVPRRDDSAAPSPPASCSRARSAGDGIASISRRSRRRAPQGAGTSAFQPSLHRSAERERFSTLGSDHARDGGGYDAAGDSERHRAAVRCRRNRFRFHRRDRQEEESKEEARRTASAAAATAATVVRRAAVRRAAGRRRATPARSRSRSGRPMPTPSSRRMRRRGGRRRRSRMPTSRSGCAPASFLLKPALEVTRGYDTNPSHGSNSPASGFTVVEPTLKMQSDWSRHEFGLDLRGSYSESDKLSSLNRPLLDTKAHSRIDVSRDTAINAESPVLPVDRLSGQPEPAGRLRQAAGLHHLRHHGRPDAALQPPRADGQGDRRPDAIPENAAPRRHHVEQPGPRFRPVRRCGARELRGVPRRQAVRRGRRRHPHP